MFLVSSGEILSPPHAERSSREDNNIEILLNIILSLEEFRYEFSKVDSPVSPDMATLVLKVLVWVVVVLELLYELLVCLDKEVCVAAADPKEVRLLAEISGEFLVKILIDR